MNLSSTYKMTRRTATIYATVFFLVFAVACKSGYRSSERVSFDQPDNLPTEYKTLRGVAVFADRQPTSLELENIDEGIAVTLNHAFREDARFIPPTLPTTWQKFRDFEDYNVILVNTVATSQNPETYGCPLIRSHAGTAAGVTGGFSLGGGRIKIIWPYILLPKLTDTRRECVEMFRNAARYEAEHVVLMNDSFAFAAFTGAFDVHPIFP